MNSLQNERTINSFLAAKKSEVRRKQAAELDKYVQEREEEGTNILHFVKYWGASGKSHADKYDMDALNMLFDLLHLIEKQYEKEVKLTLIFTDTHAMLNGYDLNCYTSYFEDIRHILFDQNYAYIEMSAVLAPYLQCNHLSGITELINSIVQESLQQAVPVFLNGRDSFERLKRSASRHSYRFSNNISFGELRFSSSDQSAYAYIKLNQLEKDYVEKMFSDNVFITYTSDEEKELIAPDLPAIQIYSCRKGIRSRPWFLNFKAED